jgi:DNA topoisomerase-3
VRLFLAEKPSLARAIADALPGPQQRRDGFILCGRDDVVAWCAGHILELAPPDTYDPAYKRWALEQLPIVPQRWALVAKAPDLLKTIRGLLPKASRVIHAGDPDREGQLLVDEVLDHLGYRGPVERLLISDLNLPAVRKALGELQPNARFRGLYEAALARQRADWLFGMNLTRLYTLLGRAGGYDGVLSVGRVQTPLLGLIVRRDQEIEGFLPQPYFVLAATVSCGDRAFQALWRAPEGGCPSLDRDGRLIDRDHARRIQALVSGQGGVVTACSSDKRSEPPPLPYSLPDLQVDAGKRLGLSPKQTLDACQALYETHRLLTYPRSDCGYLPEGQLAQSGQVLAAVGRNAPAFVSAIARVDLGRRSRAWDDRKVSAHHAIVPTTVIRSDVGLSRAERGLYHLVCRRFLGQFFPPFEFSETTMELQVAGELFRARGRSVTAQGWRDLLEEGRPESDASEGDDDQGQDGEQPVPLLEQGTRVTCRELVVTEKKTTPPRRFTEASLIQAMTGIARYVADPKIKQLLQETDGIGTPATQANIIETLFERRFIERRGRHLSATPVGRSLIAQLPDTTTRPDMTALWEAAMRRIAEGQAALPAFLSAVEKELRHLVASGRARGRVDVPTSGRPSERGSWPSSSARRRPRRRH